MIRNSAHRRAFSILEVVVALILLAALSTLLVELFNVTFRAQTGAIKQDRLLNTVDAAIASLRKDVWSAASINIDAEHRLELTSPSGSRTVWNYTPDHSLIRTSPDLFSPATNAAPANSGTTVPPNPPAQTTEKPNDPSHTYTNLPDITFAAKGPLIIVTIETAPHKPESLTLPSQHLLAKQREGAPK